MGFRWVGVVVFVLFVCSFPSFEATPADDKYTFGTPESLLTHAWKSLPRNERKAVFEELTNDPSFRRISAVDCSLESNQPDAVPLIETSGGAVFSGKLDTGGIQCVGEPSDGTIDIYRFGKIETFPYLTGCTTYRDLLTLVQKKFDDSFLSNFWQRDGTSIFLDDLVRPPVSADFRQFLIVTRPMRSQSYDYASEERFFYPAVDVNEVVTVSVPDDTGEFREMNVTTLNREPKIFLIDPFLSHEECDGILEHIFNLPSTSKLHWQDSTVGVDIGSAASGGQYRVSQTLWIGDIHNNANVLTRRVSTRAQALLKHPVELLEPLQAVRYPSGGHYYFHTDSFSRSDRSGPNPYVAGGGNRVATLLIYLSEPKTGGHTAFPLADGSSINSKPGNRNPKEGCDPEKSFAVPPKKGAAVLFYDLLEEGHMEGYYDPKSSHAGCDTGEGDSEKVIMNQW
eukprot:CAMPEP_0201488170 /NCGR_PEP_ID=MMETSP0151_2-20130828/17435_1 /ASSEMBLY_ACC=CAM_ASM_000257 /TAXON_ID=200890 /ORGANISM="Paramoeba atlantica, Strain 621/1 / CCAP 1560/9" /LENGTH=452 /DNA_ID=CAMNT_0047873407 /DNA_START=138 /DNA_END=1493 /DNA_ORIENTATION=+